MRLDWNKTLSYISLAERKSSVVSPSAFAMLREACASHSSSIRSPQNAGDMRSLQQDAAAGLIELRGQFSSNAVATNAIALLLEGKAF